MWKVVRVAAPLLLLVIVLVAISLAGSCGLSLLSSKPHTSTQELSLVEEAWQIVLNDYVDRDKLDPKELSSSAIKGMIEALNDPYTAYFDAEEYKQVNQINIEGAFGGVGAVVTIEEGQLTVVAPIKGTPAEKQGILPGDKIQEIDGALTQGMSLEEAVAKIQGKPGTQVTLKVLHKGEENPVDIVITREVIGVASVYPEIISNGIAHIKVSYFSNRTGSELVSALEEMFAKNAVGIILDLRDNPGGTLDAAVKVASQFLDKGMVLYAMDNEGKKETWEVEKGGLANTIPLVVLVNGNSASASEVVAGALQDHARGPLIGTKTFGKGSINHFRQLSDGSAIYITIARWYTPNGRQIEGNGLSPDEVVEITAEDIEQGVDPQLQHAIEYIRNQL